MLSLVEYSLTNFPSLRATPARRVMFLPAANSCCGPQFAWFQDFLKMFLLRHATVAWRDTIHVTIFSCKVINHWHND
jgi:hypothetical protein